MTLYASLFMAQRPPAIRANTDDIATRGGSAKINLLILMGMLHC
jgi:hypothetical protein